MLIRKFTDLEIAEHLGPELIKPLDQTIREAIESALILCQGNRFLAEQKLGLGRGALTYHQKKWKREDQQALSAAAGSV